MKNLLLDNLIKDLSQISSEHDNCLDETLKLYCSKEYQYTDLEQSIARTVSFEQVHPTNLDLLDEETSDIHFREEYDNQIEISGSTNSLLIEKATDIEI